MSRTHKKCLIASGSLHLLLLIILIVAPAFLIKKEEPVDQTVLTLVNTEISDQPASQPAAAGPPIVEQPVQPPEEAPPPPIKRAEIPTPKPPVEEKKLEPKPEPKPEPKKPIERKPEPVVQKKPEVKPAPKKPEPAPRKVVPVKLDLSVKTDSSAVKRAAEEQARKAAAEHQKQITAKIADAKPDFTGKFTSGMKFTSTAIGTTGVSYSSYDAHVQSVYMKNWHPPTDMPATSSTVTVKVVILRDGTVKSARIVKRSGVSKLDSDIAKLIDTRVKTIGHAFPEGATESERSYTIDFNLELKLNG